MTYYGLIPSMDKRSSFRQNVQTVPRFTMPPNQCVKETLSHGVVLNPSEMKHICFV